MTFGRCFFFLVVFGIVGSLFAQPSVVVTGPAVPALSMGAVAWADYDGDGFDDLLVCGMDSFGAGRTVLLHSTGTNLVPDLSQSLVSLMKGDAAWGDMDNDGDPDLILSGETAPGQRVTALYRNTAGLLSLIPTPNFPGLSNPRIQFADLDGDGDQDLLLGGHALMLGLVGMIGRNDGGGLFTAIQGSAYDMRDWPAFGTADLDGDGQLEVAFGDVSPLLSEGMRSVILHNNGGLHFSGVGNAGLAAYGGSFDFADVDGDGDLDMLRCGMGDAAHVGVYANNGGALTASIVGTLPQLAFGEAKFCDIDHDGDPDMVVAGTGIGGPATWVLRNTAGVFATLQAPAAMPALYNVRLAFGDWNGDGYLDLAIAGQNASDVPEAYVATWNVGGGVFEF